MPSNIKTFASVGYFDENWVIGQAWTELTMKSGIDKLKNQGFTGIDFDVSVSFTDKGSLNKLNYASLIPLLNYCKEIGLDTSIHLDWIKGSDNAAYIGSFGNEIPTIGADNFFNSILEFFTKFGSAFESAGVDLIFLGGLGGQIAGSDYHSQWSKVIYTARQSYKGGLSYQAYSPMKGLPNGDINDVSIWSLLDDIGISFKPYISETPISSLEEIESGYYFSKVNHSSVMSQLESLFNTSIKPINLQFNAFAIDNALDGGFDPTLNQLSSGPKNTNYLLQAKAFQAFLDIVINHLNLQFDTSRSVNIFLGNYGLGLDQTNWGYFDMANFPEPASSVIRNYLSNPFNFSINNSISGGPSNDIIYLGQTSTTTHLGGGFDRVYGSQVNDNIYVDPLVTFTEISGNISGWIENSINQYTISISINNEIIGKVNIFNSQNTSQSYWASQEFKFNLPSSIPPSSLKLSMNSNSGSGFTRIDSVDVYWLGDFLLKGSDGIFKGAINPLSLQHPDWLFSGEEKYFDLNKFGLNDRVIGTSYIDGGQGIDTVFFPSPYNNYTIAKEQGTANFFQIIDKTKFTPDSKIQNIERISFNDKNIAIDLNGNAGYVAKILGAVFGKTNVSNKEYVGIGLDLLDKGMSYDALAELALTAAKSTSKDQIVTTLWSNVVGSAPATADKAPFIKMLEDGMTPGALAHLAADTLLNTTNIDLVGLAQTGIEYTPVA